MEQRWKGFVHERDPLIHQVAYIGDPRKLQEILQNAEGKAMVNYRNHLGCTPLRLAATGGYTDCVRLLLQCGADVTLTDVKGQTPLFTAVKNRHIECVYCLLEAGSDPDGDDGCLCTPLYVAAMEGFLAAVKALVDYGANMDIDRFTFQFGHSSTPLYISTLYCHYDCAKVLLMAGAHVNTVQNRSVFEKSSRQLCSLDLVGNVAVSFPGAPTAPPLPPKPAVHSANQSSGDTLYHVLVRRAQNLSPERCECDCLVMILLAYECGASLYSRDASSLRAADLPINNQSRALIRTLIDTPRSLRSSCRLAVRRCILNPANSRESRRTSRASLRELPLPKTLLSYVQYEEFSTAAHRTEHTDRCPLQGRSHAAEPDDGSVGHIDL